MEERLEQILRIQSESYGQWRMFAFIIRTIYTMDVKFIILEGNIYITKGDVEVYPCIVAHMDTVHSILPEGELSILKVGRRWTGFNTATMKQAGIGGDDKVGIFIALEALRRVDNIKLVFFRDEEVGCLGSDAANMAFFDDCSFILQCDRRGNTDFVTDACGTKLSSARFQKDIEPILKKFQYKKSSGSMTDVMQLKENGLSISCANISCGYYNPHEKCEYVDLDDVFNCTELVMAVIERMGTTSYDHTPAPRTPTKVPRYSSKGGYGVDNWEDNKFEYQPGNPHITACDWCTNTTEITRFYATQGMRLCDDCADQWNLRLPGNIKY
jgi:putative aminopeptidase FrvX